MYRVLGSRRFVSVENENSRPGWRLFSIVLD